MERRESQIKAEERYRERTPKEIRNYRAKKSHAKNFILKYANNDDLKELDEMIKEKLKCI